MILITPNVKILSVDIYYVQFQLYYITFILLVYMM